MTRPRGLLALLIVVLAAVLAAALSGHGVSGSAGTAASGEGIPTGSTPTARRPPIIHVPRNLPAGKVPLLIALHGSGSGPGGMETTTGFDRLANRYGFIVAYLASNSPGYNWKLPEETNYVGSMIDHLEATEPVDPARVYVTGFSAGGYESYRSGCLLSAKVTGVAPVGVSMNPLLYRTCRISRPVSALIVIGSADAHYGGGRLPYAPAVAARWRALDGCPPAPQRTTAAPGPTVQSLWTGCADGSAVGLYTIVGGHHIWPSLQLPGASPDSKYDAAAAVWAFFAGHRSGSLTKPDAALVSVRVTRAGARRHVVLALAAAEPVTVAAGLYRGRRGVASGTSALTGGKPVGLVLQVRSRNRAGRYWLKVVLRDSFGRTLRIRRSVRLPAAGS